MTDFKDFERIWNKENAIFSFPPPPISTGMTATGKQRLCVGHLTGAMVLFVVSILNIILLLDGRYGERTGSLDLTFSIISVLCIYQSWLYLAGYRKLRMIDPASAPLICLNRWLDFNDYRKKTFKQSVTVFNIAIGLLLNMFVLANAERFSIEKNLVILGVLNTVTVYSYFAVVKKTIRKQANEIDQIITELKNKFDQIKEVE